MCPVVYYYSRVHDLPPPRYLVYPISLLEFTPIARSPHCLSRQSSPQLASSSYLNSRGLRDTTGTHARIPHGYPPMDACEVENAAPHDITYGGHCRSGVQIRTLAFRLAFTLAD